jgi:mycothiol synthase
VASQSLTLSTPTSLDDGPRAEVLALATRVEARDGQPPLSDQALTHLGSAAVSHVLARDGADLVGYAQRDGASLEVVAGQIEALDALLAEAERGAPAELQAWSHGQASPVAAALEARGYRRERVLHQLRARLRAEPVAEPPPAGVTIRPFVVGVDEPAWLRVNAAAFAHHPEQGSWSSADLSAREAEAWFDAAGLLLAEQHDTVVGFHWTKVHDALVDGRGLGEVYVLGIDPSAQGLGLGRVLLAAGLRHLFERGCRTVLLYVDDSNTTALRLYERAGFERYDHDEQWQRP